MRNAELKAFRAIIVLMLLSFSLFFAVHETSANDNPHNINNTMSCGSCHDDTKAAQNPDWWTDQESNVCGQCHNALGPGKEMSAHRDPSGNVIAQCTQCHDPHTQWQFRSQSSGGWGSLSYLETGISSAVTTTYLIKSGATWTADYWKDMVLIPDVRYPAFNYRITGNTTNTITISTTGGDAIYTALCKSGATFAVVYGKLIRTSINGSSVKFFQETGANSFVDTVNNPPQGVCQVCHTSTNSFNSGGTLETGAHPAQVAGTNCGSCHKHDGGFKPDCNSCHGNPPVTSAQGANGLVNNEGGTGSTSPGAHVKHASSGIGNYGFDCTNCHTGGMPAGTIYDKILQIGFNIDGGAYKTGTYYSRSTLSNGYTYAPGNGGTTIIPNNALTCSNVYCHSNTKNVFATTPAWTWTGGPLTCAGCHDYPPSYTNGGAGSFTANSHPRHVISNSIGCSVCHNQTTLNNTSIRFDVTPIRHVDGNKDVNFDQNINGSYDAGTKTCSGTSCHQAGQPVWGGNSLVCDSCHHASNLLAGKHSTHYATANVATNRDAANNSTQGAYIFNCGVCHYQTTHAGGAVSTYQIAEVKFDGSIAGGGTYTTNGNWAGTDNGTYYTAGTCQSTYCHSNGRGGTPNNMNFSWDTNSSLRGADGYTCTGCHGYTAASSSPIVSGKHAKHVGSYTYSCSRCHNATTTDGATIADRTKHVNGTKDVAWDSFNSFPTATYANRNCTNLYCHSQGTSVSSPSVPNTTASWDATFNAYCTGCHNGDDTSGNPMSSGTHTAHMNNAGVIGINFTCDQCHNATVASGSTRIISTPSNSHVNKAIDVRFSSLNPSGSYSTDGHAPGAGYGNCTNLYCHSNGKGNSVTATWGGQGLGCNGCHGTGNNKGAPDYPNGDPGSETENSHPKHALSGNISCSACHNQTTTTGTSIRTDVIPSKHINTSVQDVYFDLSFNPSGTYNTADKTCSSLYCHGPGSTPRWGGASLLCSSCHEASSNLSNDQANNRHYLHYATITPPTSNLTTDASVSTAYVFNCGNCHDPAQVTHGGGPAPTGFTAEVKFNVVLSGITPTSGTYSAGTTTYTDSKGFTYSGATCSSVYCHSNGSPLGSTISYKTATWNQTQATPNCNVCHEASPTTNKHSMHVGTYGFGCIRCHSATVSDNTTIKDRSVHVNGTKNVAWDVMNPSGYQYASPNCTNLYCHSQGTSLASPLAPNTNPVAWNGGSLACEGCHGGDRNATNKMSTNAHTAHINTTIATGRDIGCADCHRATVSANTTMYNRSNHVNRSVNIKFDNVLNLNSDNPTYSGQSTTGANGWPVDPSTLGSCNNVYCHSTGNVDASGSVVAAGSPPVSFRTITWNDSTHIGCDGCHGDQAGRSHPTYASGTPGGNTANSHVAHVENDNLGCAYCHVNTVGSTITTSPTSMQTNTYHLNRVKDVSFLLNYGWTGTYDPVNKQCSATYCHGGSASPKWGGSVQCDSCHEASSNLSNDQANNRHYLHYATITPPTSNLTTNASISTAYVFNCGNCHDPSPGGVTHAGGPAPTGVTAEVKFNISWAPTTTGIYTVGSATLQDSRLYIYSKNATCSSVYCHSNGSPLGSTISYKTATWNQTQATPNCNVCHEASPTTNKHSMHVGTYGFGCIRCHSATVSDNMTIKDRSVHVNGTKNVAWDVMNPSGYQYASPNCTNLYCHSQGTSLTSPLAPNTNPVAWNGGSLACDGCHGGDQNATNKMSTNAHTAHVNSTGSTGRNIGCAECHRATVSANTTMDNRSNHVNQSVNIKFDNVLNLNSDNPTYSGQSTTGSNGWPVPPSTLGSCNNVYCHSTGNVFDSSGTGTVVPADGQSFRTITWNDSTHIGCDGCHGNQAGKAYPTYSNGGPGTTANSHVGHVENSHLGCAWCHVNTMGSMNTTSTPTSMQTNTYHLNRVKDVSFMLNNGQTGTYNSSAKSCSNTYCHGSGTPPVWGSLAGCATCHEASSNLSNDQANNRHFRHYATTTPPTSNLTTNASVSTAYVYNCGNCHDPAQTTHAGGAANTNGTGVSAEVKFDVALSGTTPTTGVYSVGTTTYTDSKGYVYSNATCNSVYCHSNGAPLGGTPIYQLVTWNQGTAAPNNCNICHEATPSTNKHPKHANSTTGYGFSCVKCHSATVSDSTTIKDRSLHVNGTKNVVFEGLNSSGSYSSGNNACSNTYCHSNGVSVSTGGNPQSNTTPAWNTGSLTCNGCHGYPPSYPNNNPKANSHAMHNATAYRSTINCSSCHYSTTTDGNTIASISNHLNGSYDLTQGSGVSFSYNPATPPTTIGGSCSSISCHNDYTTTTRWGTSACLNCHRVSQGGRAAIYDQISGRSHHIQGVTPDGTHCYQCHWEANSDGSINPTYHHGTAAAGTNAPIELVIYSNGTRSTNYVLGVTATTYTAGTRTGIANVTTHCLGCHSNQTTSYPFGDGKRPNYYAWDGSSVASRYTSTTTTTWGKYRSPTYPNTAQKNLTKAYSAHGNAANNQEGWSTTTGVDETISDSTGTTNVQCFDCHNSHGSTVSGVTTNYTSSTENGGLLKDTTAGKGGYTATFQPVSGGTTSNLYNPGAALCYDCHLNSAPTTTVPWGYSTFGATQPIMGYWDMGPDGAFASQSRYQYKAGTSLMGGHFGHSSSLTSTPLKPINGLCTPCHDPHGVSPTIANAAYAVPLLKGTWMTSPYKEDVAPVVTYIGSSGCGGYNNQKCGNAGTYDASYPSYHIDENTFSSISSIWSWGSTTRVTEDVNIFGGLCLQCHPKGDSNNPGLNPNGPNASYPWRSMNRVHNTVKGWGGENSNGTFGNQNNAIHSYTCSKCHTVHNSRLSRLLVTNCLDYTHRGQAITGGQPGDTGATAYDQKPNGSQAVGGGSGRYPYGGHGNHNWSGFGGTGAGVTCHDNTNGEGWPSNQRWNTVSNWDSPPSLLATPQFIWDIYSTYTSTSGSYVTTTVTWQTNAASSSYVDYGLTAGPPYTYTTGSSAYGYGHSVLISMPASMNHHYIHLRVRSGNSGGWMTSGDYSYYISVPPYGPTLTPFNGMFCSGPTCTVPLSWATSTDPDNGPIQYQAQIDTLSSFNTPSLQVSSVQTGTTWSPVLSISSYTTATWYWTVKTRDANHTQPYDPWSDWASTLNFLVSSKLMSIAAGTPFLNPGNSHEVDETITWWTDVAGSSVVDYGASLSYGQTTTVSGLVTSHTVTLYNVPNHATTYYRVRSTDGYGNEIVSAGTRTFSANVPPSQPHPNTVNSDYACLPGPCSETVSWTTSTDPDYGTVNYQAQIDTSTSFNSANLQTSSWQAGTSWSPSLATNNTWYFRVRAADVTNDPSYNYPTAWSNYGSFAVSGILPPPMPIMNQAQPPTCSLGVCSYCYYVLSWSTVTAPDNDYARYQLQVSSDSSFGTVDYDSGAPTGANSGLTATSTQYNYPYPSGGSGKVLWWRVRAWDNYHYWAASNWTVPQYFEDTGTYYVDSCNCTTCPPATTCPFLFVSDGKAYNYLTDLQGEMIGLVRKNKPIKSNVTIFRPSYIVLHGLKPDSDNEYGVKIRETIEEVDYADKIKLLLADYPEGYEIVSSSAEDTYAFGYSNPFTLYTIKNPIPPLSATDKNGKDVLDKILHLDGARVHNQESHEGDNGSLEFYTLDFGKIKDPAHAKLVIDAWSAYGDQYVVEFSNRVQPYIEVPDKDGTWVKVKTFGPVGGDLKTMVVDIANVFLSNDHRIRLHLGLGVGQRWAIDRIRLDDSAPVPVKTREMDASYADLHYKGRLSYDNYGSLEKRVTAVDDSLPDTPESYAYGRFTRYGDVRELLTASDDKFVIMRHGDELSLKFPQGGALEKGMTRAAVLIADVYYKGVGTTKTVDPLPFHAMSLYPYPENEHYPMDKEHADYLAKYNTRVYTMDMANEPLSMCKNEGPGPEASIATEKGKTAHAATPGKVSGPVRIEPQKQGQPGKIEGRENGTKDSSLWNLMADLAERTWAFMVGIFKSLVSLLTA